MANPGFSLIWDTFKAGMTRQGFIEGQNVTYINEPTPELLAKKVKVNDLDLILLMGGTFGMPENALQQVKTLTLGQIPVVVVPGSGDPVNSGDANRLQLPGKNITGVLLPSADDKRFELFAGLFPNGGQNIAVVYDSDNAEAVDELQRIEAIAQREGLALTLLETPSSQPEKTEQALVGLPDNVNGIFLLKVWGPALRWFQLGYDRKIPTSMDGIGSDPDTPQPLMAYGPSFEELGQQAARLAGQVLQGKKAGDVPMEYAGYYLTIDLGVADAIGFDVSNAMLAQARYVNHTDAVVFAPPPTAAPSGLQLATDTGACTASLTSPGGVNSICVTTTCEKLVDSSFIKYSNKQDVTGCAATNLVGICKASAFDTYYYDGQVATLRIGCGFSAGTWTTP